MNIFRGVEEQVPVRRKLQVETYQQAITSLIRSGFDTGSMYGLQGEILDYQGSITLTEVNYIIPVECKSSIRLVKGDQTQIVRYSPDNTLQDLCNLAIAYDFGTSIGLVLALEPLQSYSTKLAEIPFFSVITPAEIPHLEITDITIPRNIKFGEMFHPPVRRLDFDGDGDNDFNPCFEEIYPKHGLN